MPDSSDIGNALVAKLSSDPTLLGYVPNGVYFDEAPPNATRFVIVRHVIGFDEGVFGGRAIEEVHYEVEARILSTSGGNVKAAAARIDELLDDQPLTAPGYAWMDCYREEPIRFIETDEVSPDIRWFRRGGRYVVRMAVAS